MYTLLVRCHDYILHTIVLVGKGITTVTIQATFNNLCAFACNNMYTNNISQPYTQRCKSCWQGKIGLIEM